MIDAQVRSARFERLAAGMTWLIAIVVLTLLSAKVVGTRANLAWDDADYLRRGLTNARMAESAGGLWVVPVALDRLFLEAPKPPWLVAWIELGALVLGRHHLDLLILFSSIVPYAFLLMAVVVVGRKLGGIWAGLVALICLVSSRSSLSLGGKVMVETYLSFWVLLSFALAAFFVTRPSRRLAIALGAVIGLALLTKLTIVLFLPALAVYLLASVPAAEPNRWKRLRNLLWCGGVCLAVAGPWYARNMLEATRFAAFSARYNELAELRPDRVPAARRVVVMAKDLAGWPLCATIVTAALAAWRPGVRRWRGDASHGRDQSTVAVHFRRMAWLSALAAAAILLYPPYFDSRFLVPIWPVLAVAIGTTLAAFSIRLHFLPRAIVGFGLACSMASASTGLAVVPQVVTYWHATELIDELVTQHGVSTLVNLGNSSAWNVCKTGLINELRDQPENCFVLHDLTKLAGDRAGRLLTRADAVVVLDRSEIPQSLRDSSPGLNRGYETLIERLASDPRFCRIRPRQTIALPQLTIYVRRTPLDQARETPKSRGVNDRY
jgi:Dolichyl-phosphate-mannose-protein mannosyltransferase